MANHISHASLPYPVKNARYTILVPYLDADGDPTDPTTPDTEVSQDGGAFADAAEEVTTITGTNGMGYITLSGAETNNSAVGLAFKVASGPKATLATLYPRNLPILASGTASAGAAGSITLASSITYDITGCFVRTTGGTGGGGTGGANNQARRITAYNTSTQVATVTPNWETTPDGTTTYDVLCPEGITPGMLKALNPTTAGRTLDVASTGEAGLDFNNVLSSSLVTLHSLTVTNATTLTGNVSMAAGLTITQSTTDGHGISVAGNGTGNGIRAVGGATGHGIIGLGGATSGSGIRAEGSAGNSVGLQCVGIGTSAGFRSVGGATGPGMALVGGGTSGAGVSITTTSGDGISVAPTAGHGLNLAANGTSKHGLFATGGTGGTSDGISAVAGTGGVPIRGDITGNITGTLTTVTTATNVTTVNGLAANVITAASIATGAIDADALAADASTEIRSVASGTADSGTTTTMVDAALTQADDDYWKGAVILFTSGSIAGQARLITGFTASSDTITFAPATTQAVGTNTYEILPAGRVDLNSILGSAVSTSTAQLGVNVVNAGGTAWGSGAITASAIAADAITAAKIADGAIDANTFAAGAINAAAIATGAIDADAVAADVTTELRALVSGTADSGTTTTMVDAALTQADDDYWKGAIILFTSGNIAGQARLITGFTASSDTVTFAPATTQAVGTNTYEILPFGRVDLNSILGSAVSTSTAQLGVNVVSAAGTAWASGAITAAVIATDAIDSDAIAASAVTEIQAGLSTLTTSQVNAEVVDALATDTYAEPGQGTPTATTTLAAKINYLYKAWRNKKTQTSSQYSLFADDTTTIDQKSTVSDDGTTTTVGEVATGP